MKWWGKIAGAALGYLAGGPLGVAIGIFAGHQFDRGLQSELEHPDGNLRFRPGFQRTRKVFFETTFAIMGHLAKADGRVSEVEIRAARSIMHQMRLSPEQVQIAIKLFNDGKQPDFPWRNVIKELRGECQGRHDLQRAFVEIQVQAVLADGNISNAERSLLWEISRELGISRVELAQIEALVRAHHARSGRAKSSLANNLSQAYTVLGLQANATDAEVKTAYRRLMNQHHPDKLVSRGLPEEMMIVAKEKTREIRTAYDTVRDSRGMR